MSGSSSDSYDPEFGTTDNAEQVCAAIKAAYEAVTEVLDGKPPEPILEVAFGGPRGDVQATLDERVWRCLRFACERALESF